MDYAKMLLKMRGLNHVRRWNFHPTTRDENVAEHSFWVVFIAMVLESKAYGINDIDVSVMLAALLHDAEESITGDLPSLVKRFTPWNGVEEKARAELFGVGGSMPPDTPVYRESHVFNDLCDMSKSNTLIRMADTMSALLFATEQVKCGNLMFTDIEKECLGSVRTLVHRAEERLAQAASQLLMDMGYASLPSKDLPQGMSHL
jgi:5'-deoxynucleotidase